MNELAIDSKDLTKAYGNIRAVGGINLSVPRGAIYGFLGRNGAGKMFLLSAGPFFSAPPLSARKRRSIHR
jgi:ABC-type multidrug transport system ATPase subunit